MRASQPEKNRISSILIAMAMQLFCIVAGAQIVYTNVNAPINGSYNLDLNNDGITDFILQGTSTYDITCGYLKISLSVVPASMNNEVMTDGAGYAIDLLNGSAIVPDSQWSNTSQVLYDDGTTCNHVHTGHWSSLHRDEYLGLRFTKNNNTYYGWARITLNFALIDYAYNSAAGGPTFAGHGASTVFPQTAPAIQWQKSLGSFDLDYGRCIRQTTDGGFIVAGFAGSTGGDVTGNHGSSDYWIVKLNSSGAIQWQKSIGGSNSDYALSIMQTADGGYIVCGETYSTDGDVTDNHGSGGSTDGWIVKLNSSGTIEWQKCLGGSDYDVFYSIVQTADGGYIVCGETNSNDGDVSGNHGSVDGWILKLNGAGTIQWQKCLGGSGYDLFRSVIQTADGGYIAAGGSDSNDGDVSGNHGQQDLWVIKLNSNGGILWQKTMGGSDHDAANSIQQTTDGGYIVAGETSSNDGDVSGNHGIQDCWIVKLNNTGAIEWKKVLGSSGIGASGIQEEFYSVWQTTDGGYIAGGWSGSNDGDVSGNHGGEGDYWLVKFNSAGDPQWQKCLGGSQQDWAWSLQQTADGGYIVTGYAGYSNDGDVSGVHGNQDYWIVKLGADVALPLHLLSFTGALQNNAVKLRWQTTNEINTKDFIVERSTDGINFSAIGKVDAEISPAINHSYNYTDNAPLPGSSYYRLKMEDKDGSFTYSPVVKINYNKQDAIELTVAPNPVFNSTSVSFTIPQPQHISLKIFDVNGKLIKTLADKKFEKGKYKLQWNIAEVSAGIYFMHFEAGKFSETKKLSVIK